MDPARWDRLRSVFLEALDRDEGGTRELLREVAGEDAEMALQVEQLLRDHARVDDFLVPPDLVPGSERETPPLVGKKFDDLEILRSIDGGGMGEVYLARQASLDRLVAVKVLRRSPGEGPSEELRKEAARIARLRHPGIVAVHRFGCHEGIAYFVMDYIEGCSLAQVLADRAAGRPGAEEWTPGRVATVIRKVAQALDYSHQNGLVHRDVKPANILIDADDEPHLVDFGIAKEVKPDARITRVVGTPHYMSPEQARHGAVIDHHSDLFSLGVVLYELLTQTKPFQGETDREVLDSISYRQPASLRKINSQVPRDLDTICQKAMRKEVRHRYHSGRELAEDLQRFLEHKAPRAKPPTVTEHLHAGWRQYRRVLLVGATLLVVAATSFRVALWWHDEKQRQELIAALPADLATFDAGSEEQTLDQLRRWHEETERKAGLFPSGSQKARLEKIRAELEARISAQLERAQAEVSAILSQSGRGVRGVDLGRLQESLMVVRTALSVLPDADSGALEKLQSTLFPRLTVRSDPPGAEVRVSVLVPDTGLVDPTQAVVHAGLTDLVDYSISPGYYRIQAVDGAGRMGEVRMMLTDYAAHYETPLLVLRDPAAVTADMVLLPAGRYRVPPRELISHLNQGFAADGTLELPAYWVDREEVTNGAYRAFCDATGRPYPRTWPANWDPAWDALPAGFIDCHDAGAYAAWAGKRLLTVHEWQRAARGLNGWLTPWSPEFSGEVVATLANVRNQLTPAFHPQSTEALEESNRREWELYLGQVRPAGSSSDRSPEGLTDMLGSLREWTATFAYNQVHEGVFQPTPGVYCQLGSSWDSWARDLSYVGVAGASATDDGGGFRCGRSVTP